MKVDVEVLIVGAGISGLSLACWLKKLAPSRSFEIFEARDRIGGTWDLFRYPGIRSDSEMFTLGFAFKPWRDDDAIASGDKIMEYLDDTVKEFSLNDHIRLGHKVLAANWNQKSQLWEVEFVSGKGKAKKIHARFLYMGTGYYDYEKPFDPEIKGQKSFAGELFHAQFWPANLEYSGKNVVIIGSGATALTVIPTMAKSAARVTMLQRSPSYVFNRPKKDLFANIVKRILPANLAYDLTRLKFTFLSRLANNHILKHPEDARKRMLDLMKRDLPKGFDMRHFTPSYNVWDQRVCAAPDGDFFTAVKSGNVDVVTGHISRITKSSIELVDGNKIDADIIVKATGLNLIAGPKFKLSIDGKAVDISKSIIYKGAMFSNVPNFAFVFGYLMASWTLKADLVARFFIRFMDEVETKGAKSGTPFLDINTVTPTPMFNFSSGYITRSIDKLPKQTEHFPWQINQDYKLDKNIFLVMPIDDGVLKFGGE